MRAEDPAPPPSPPEEVFYGPAPRSGADDVRARIAAEHEAARARREANPAPEPLSARYGSCCPICREDWVVNTETRDWVPDMEARTYACCCKKICKSCSDKLGSAPCPLCRAPPLEDAEALAHIHRHVKEEVPEAVKLLGDAYIWGDYGLVQSFEKGALLYERAMKLGDVEAMNNLALILTENIPEGRKLPKAAIRLWRRAADRGHAEAQHKLGFFYENGSRIEHVDDFEVNLWEALRLYKRSANKGFQRAKDDLDDLKLRITEALVDQKLDGLVEKEKGWVGRGKYVRPRSRRGPFRLLG